jgi:hypothetical protein
MFEKEAEEWFEKLKRAKVPYTNENVNKQLHKAFKNGAEYGYNKANEWHDLRKDPNDLPKENVTVLLLTEVEPVTARYDNNYEAFFRLNDKLDYCVFIAPMNYIAWKEIVPPETKREKNK